jgi:hypothetical protein
MITRTLSRRKELLENRALVQRQMLREMQLEWLAAVDVAAQHRQSWILQLEALEQSYTIDEIATLDTGLELLLTPDIAVHNMRGVRKARHPSNRNAETSHKPKTTMTTYAVDHDLTRRRFVGRANAVIRASPHHLAAHLCNASSQRMPHARNAAVTATFEVLAAPNDHSAVVFEAVKSALFQSRTFLTICVCRRVCANPPTYVWVAAPLPSHELITPEREKNAVRGELFRCFRLTASPEDPNTTTVEYAAWIDCKGTLPASVLSSFISPKLMDLPYQMQASPPFGPSIVWLRSRIETQERRVG